MENSSVEDSGGDSVLDSGTDLIMMDSGEDSGVGGFLGGFLSA